MFRTIGIFCFCLSGAGLFASPGFAQEFEWRFTDVSQVGRSADGDAGLPGGPGPPAAVVIFGRVEGEIDEVRLSVLVHDSSAPHHVSAVEGCSELALGVATKTLKGQFVASGFAGGSGQVPGLTFKSVDLFFNDRIDCFVEFTK